MGGPPVGLYGLEVESYELTEIVNPLENTWDEHSDGYYSGPMMYFDISPDGSRIVFSTCRYFDPNTSKFRYSGPNSYEIVVSNIDGTEILRLTENSHVDNYPVWSPDGTRIAFISDRDVRVYDRYPVGRLYTMAPDGSDVRHVTTEFDEGSSFFVGPHPPNWSPDGNNLTFVVYESGLLEDRRAVYTVGADGSGLTRIADALSEPAWSPDGRRLALVVPEGEYGVALYVYASDGSDPIRVAGLFTNEAEQIRHFNLIFMYYIEEKSLFPWIGGLSWSPDGSMILLEATGVRVSVVDGHVDYSLPLILTVANTSDVYARSEIARRSAAWSPDGSRIAVRASVLAEENMGWRDFSDGSVVLYTMSREGTDLRILVRSVHTGVGESPYLIKRRYHIPAKSSETGAWGSRLVAWNPNQPPADASACYAGYVVSEPRGNGGLAQDCLVLLRMRDTLSGSGVLDWSSDTPITEWAGVRVEGEPLRVRGLDFYDLGENLFGRVPLEVASLSELRVLRVSDSQIDGPIPAELGNLSSLDVLDLGGNQLSGSIPPELGNLTRLNELSLESNQLTGAIPVELGKLVSLRKLNLAQNRLIGSMPGEFGNLKNLEEMLLTAGNEVTGCAPPVLRYVEDTDLEVLGFCEE